MTTSRERPDPYIDPAFYPRANSGPGVSDLLTVEDKPMADTPRIIKLPPGAPPPKGSGLCWQTGELGTPHGMTHCTLKRKHKGPHSWEAATVATLRTQAGK